MLTCTRCNRSQANRQFSPDASVRSDRGSWCRSCKKEYQKEYAKLLKKEGGISKGRFNWFGILEAEYNRMLDIQGGGCAGCGALPKEDRRLSIDHKHQVQDKRREPFERTDKCRGLLCYLCNKALGVVRDNAETLKRLANYLENPPAKTVVMPRFEKAIELLKEFEVKTSETKKK